jgi:endonuclease-3 related protein
VIRSSKNQPPPLGKIYKTLLKFYGPQGWWPGDSSFEVVVGAILTQNTSWQNVEKAINNLKSKNLLDPHKIHRTPAKKLASHLTPSGYFNIKSKRLKSTLKYLIERYDGNLKRMSRRQLHPLREELLQVNGIGKETCDSILLYALNKPIFVVDAYTKRIFSRLGLISENATYDETQEFFMNNINDVDSWGRQNGDRITNHQSRITNPASRITVFNEYHALIVRHGKILCRKKPLCNECPLLSLSCNYGKR